ncbi:ABC transporter ATP-binding protein [Pseudoflavonifractor sp. MSJ-37]|uniref:ABC transporter ATP-binding protein n=1 Tax=Pseudoflavonifractor sp. MSJ-37 TaxID=2841531 RepID=UPI001C0FBF94|nr:ABC transporter ATP-binding protein [Pseudoflavonifractor sp. MSJ-37]MBU5435459.1 ABC transporter ATP-binding protein [Pseudoflavonifractor sp. MSJ-37]
MSKIDIQEVSFHYPGQQPHAALEEISLSIEEGEFLCLLGPSGCGKSTLLSLLEGLDHADGGQILLDGAPLTGPGPDRAVVFQHYSLFPWLTARKNVIFGIRQSGQKRSKPEQKERADYYLSRVGLSNVGDRYPSELSGGMQQRVAIARALAMETDVLLMDEPFGAIDPKLRQELQELVSRLSTEHHKTVVFVTHDIDEAILLADRIVVMEPKQIRAVERVELPRPRKRDDLVEQPEYLQLRKRLMSLFYEQVASEIGDEVVL